MTRASYLKQTTIISGVLTAVGTVFWYAGSPVFRLEIAGMTAPLTIDAVLLLPAAVIAGADIARRAWQALRRRVFGIELLVTLAAVGAVVLGEFFEAAAVTFLFALGGYLENRAMSRTRDALRNLWQSVPSTATVVTDDGEEEVPAARVRPGDLVLVRPGARVPVDGTVERGASSIDESTITGESVPADKEVGSNVYSATVNQEGLLYIRTERAGRDTTVARIIARVEEAQDSRTKSERVIDRFARYYTPAVIAGSLMYFLFTGNLHVALTLLVVACPGALVIAAPVAVISSIGSSAKHGVLIRGGAELETAARVTTLATDKTGTLTTGTLHVARVTVDAGAAEDAAAASGGDARGAGAAGASAAAVVAGGAETVALHAADAAREDEVLRLAAIAEAGSEHPIGRAIRSEAEARFGPLPHGEEFEYRTGRGVSAVWEGRRIEVARAGGVEGNSARGVERGDDGAAGEDRAAAGNGRAGGNSPVGAAGPLAARADGNSPVGAAAPLAAHGAETVVSVSVDGEPVGTIALADTVRADAPEAIAALRRLGIERVILLTGDNPETAAAVAAECGITEVHAGLLPDQKLEHIRFLQSEGETVAMLGDGVNDAPSLAAADTGIAMGAAGSDLAVESADLALMSHRLTAIPQALRGARSAIRIIRQNLVIALVTVVLLFAGVLAGQIHRAGGMLVHQGSILLVIANGLRLRRYGSA